MARRRFLQVFLPAGVSDLPWPFGASSMANSDSSRNLRSGEVRFINPGCNFDEIGIFDLLVKFAIWGGPFRLIWLSFC